MKPINIRTIKMKLPIILSLVIFILLGSVEKISACSTGSEIPSFCEMVGSADVIFVGKVIGAKKQRIIIEDGVKEIWDVGEIYFEVQEGFVGVKKGIRLTVRSGDEEGYCGTPFKRNEIYLIYGYGKLKTGFVEGSRSNLITEAQNDLESLRNLPKNGSGSKIFGSVIQDSKNSLLSDNQQPLTNINIRIQQQNGRKQFFETSTDSNGEYVFNNIPAGKYSVNPILSKSIEYYEGEIEIKDRGCAIENFHVRNKTKISGKVLDAEGKIVKDIRVELVPAELAEKPKPFTLQTDNNTDTNGEFSIKNIPPGQYTLSVNYTTSPDEDEGFPTTFYPIALERSQAMIFEIKLGDKNIENLEFRLPARLETGEIKGIIVWSDGTPVNDAHVGLRDAEDNFYTSDMRTDKSGSFTLKGFKGRKYFISADNYSSDNAESASYISSEKFILSANNEFHRLVLEKKEK